MNDRDYSQSVLLPTERGVFLDIREALVDEGYAVVSYDEAPSLAVEYGTDALKKPRILRFALDKAKENANRTQVCVVALTVSEGFLTLLDAIDKENRPNSIVALSAPMQSRAELAVRRQNIWRRLRRRLAECGPRLGVGFKRRACGVASADVRWFFA